MQGERETFKRRDGVVVHDGELSGLGETSGAGDGSVTTIGGSTAGVSSPFFSRLDSFFSFTGAGEGSAWIAAVRWGSWVTTAAGAAGRN